jgi:hypothetical protein
MKKIFVAGCLAVLILVVPWGSHSQDTEKDPSLALTEKEFDAGEVMEGSIISHDFMVLNKGDAPLEIRRIAAG